MKIEITQIDSRYKITIRYTRMEWSAFEKLYRDTGLELRRIRNLWGVGMSVDAYAIPDNVSSPFADAIDMYNRDAGRSGYPYVVDDLNRPLTTTYNNAPAINIAFLRVVPTCDDNECVTVLDNVPIAFVCFDCIKMLPRIIADIVRRVKGIYRPLKMRVSIEIVPKKN